MPELGNGFDRLDDLRNVSLVDNDIYGRFSSDWWIVDGGKFQGLHMITGIRVEYFKAKILEWVERNQVDKVKIADVGCGGGILTERLTKELLEEESIKKVSVVGIDISREAVRSASDHLRKVGTEEMKTSLAYLEGSAYDLPLGNSSVNIVIMSDVLEHLSDLRNAMKEIKRILRANPEALFLFDTMPRTLKSFTLYVRVLQDICRIIPKNTHDWRLFVDPTDMDRLFKEFGFLRPDSYVGFDMKFYSPLTILDNLYRTYISKEAPLPFGGPLSLFGTMTQIDSLSGSYFGCASLKTP